MATVDSGSIRTLQKHIEDMRSLVMCKICLKPFYEPYILTCGHTYCYSCLNNWFTGNAERRKNRNCPDCRTVVKVQPAPNYLLRDLTHMFIGRTELLPEDETVEEHNKDKSEEASILARDRNGGGLFQGMFRPALPYGPGWGVPPAPIRDLEDGVHRCPRCTWELEDGMCNGCGLDLNSEPDVDFSDDLDEDSDSEDSDSVSERPDLQMPRPPQQFYGVEMDSEDEDDDLAGSQDDNQYDLHDDFVDDENEDDADDMDGINGYAGWPSDAGTPYSEDFSVDDILPNGEYEGQHRHDMNANALFSSDDEDDSDEDIRPPPTRSAPAPAPPTRRRPIVISDEEDEGEDHQAPACRNPSQSAVRPDGESDENSEDHADDGSEDDSHSDSDSESRDSDDTITPPQTNRVRRQRLQEHRARRPPPNHRVTIDLVTPPHHQQRGYGRSAGDNTARSTRRSRATPVY